MKVYILPTSTLNLTINLMKIKKYLIKKTTTNTIFTPHGLFQFHKNKIMCVEIVDVPCKKHNIDEVDFIIDYSKTKFGEECLQLPVNHIIEQITSYEYTLRPGGQVHFIAELINDTDNAAAENIKDVYFLANDDINLQILNEDIISFLGELNLC